MKKSWIVTLLGIVTVVLLGFPAKVSAVPVAKVSTSAAIIAPTPQPTPILYVLPYPGILPTHPLYFLKSIRDKIIEALISDPVSKAEFYMLQADKKLSMGITFQSMEKPSDAKKAYAEALSMRERAVRLVETHMQAGNEVPRHVLEKLQLSFAKHEEVLINAGEDSKSLQASREVMQKLLGQ